MGGPWKANALRYLLAGVLPKGCVMTTTLNWREGESDGFATFLVGKVPALLPSRSILFSPRASILAWQLLD